MAEKEMFLNGERIGEVWAAFLAKLALKVDKTTLEDYPTTEAMATAIATALGGYATNESVTTAITTALADYMTESDVNAAIASAIGGVSGGFVMTPVETLPETGKENVIYLVPKENTTDDNDVRDEFIWLNGKYERIGSTSVDLSDYWSKEDLQPMTEEELAAILV